MIDAKSQNLSPDEQTKLDGRMIDAAEQGRTETVRALLADGAYVRADDDSALDLAARHGHTATVQALLAAGAYVHAGDDKALRHAALNNQTETVQTLIAAGANVHAEADYALRWAAYYDWSDTVQILIKHIFAPDSWHGKNRTEIEGQANALYDKIKTNHPQEPIKPEVLRKAGTALFESAMQCWEQIRPPPPKLQISPFPAQPRPL